MGKKLSQTEFINRCLKVHGEKYEYSKVVYLNMNQKVKLECKHHGIFEQLPGNHLKGFGCPKCSGYVKRTNEQFLKESIAIHGTKYDYSRTNYTLLHAKVEIICSKHGLFTQKPTHHLNGHGCQKCRPTGSEHFAYNPDREYVKLRKKMAHRCANILLRGLKDLGKLKNSKHFDIMGYTAGDLFNHITQHSNWPNVKDTKWAIDHIFPVKAFVEYGITDIRIINALDNLQPLEYIENSSKGGQYDKTKFLEYLKSKNVVPQTLVVT